MKRFVLGASLLLATACNPGMSTLRAEHLGNSVVIHVETLGEYPTSVGRIRLTEVSSSKTIWEIQRSAGTPQLWKFELRSGENPVIPTVVTGGGSFSVVAPIEAESFSLSIDSRYRLTVWNADESRSRTIEFELKAS